MSLFSSSTFGLLEQSLKYSSLKQKTIADNIANVDTPGYKAKEAVFKSELTNAIHNQLSAKRTDSRHVEFQGGTSGKVFIRERSNTEYNHNGNNVDIDKEMSEMAKNQIYYNALIDRLNGKFNSLQTVIKGGR